jgi:hypothetical protein
VGVPERLPPALLKLYMLVTPECSEELCKRYMEAEEKREN